VVEQTNGNRLLYDLTIRPGPAKGEILLKVRFASVDWNGEADLGLGLVSTDAAVNTFLVRTDIDLLATIRALEARNAVEILAEQNIMAINGKQATFVAGRELPFPALEGGAVTIQSREFGVRLNFLPNITPRGTVRLQVTPEVSSLDYAHAVTSQGFTIAAPTTRRVQTEVELESGQSFAIGGLLDNSTTENLSKISGLAISLCWEGCTSRLRATPSCS
jgi:pilus assembly protein CpaC